MPGYYAERLSAGRLRRCYEIAPARVRRYLEAEIAYVADRGRPSDAVLELGCGYGRVLEQLAPRARKVVGIDTSRSSLELAGALLARHPNCRLVRMDAAALGFCDGAFDVVVCIQNGISAFNVDRRRLISESLRVTRVGGRVLFSSYAEGFWPHRLGWFQRQAEEGLVGEIDWGRTGDGVIVCKDGFRATTVGVDEFAALAEEAGAAHRIEEVDGSSLFCTFEVS